VRASDPDGSEHLEVVLMPLGEFVALAKQGELLQAVQLSSLFFALASLGRVV